MAPTRKSGPVRAAVYCRISSDKEKSEGLTALGVKRQEADCRKLCADRGWTVVEPAYVDNNISAADPRKRRPAYQQLLADITAGRVDAVVVWAEDRLHRRPAELEGFVTTCEAAGMKTLASVSGDVDLNDPDALMLLRFKAAMAAREVEKTRQRLLRKQQELAEAGRPTGGGKRAFGWERDGMTIRDSEATLIREAAGVILAGGTLRSIAADWNARRIPTVTGSPWTPNSVKATLRSPRNTGLRQYRGEVVGEAVWPAIIDRDSWQHLQVLFSAPGRHIRTPHRNYPLRGVMRCSSCGRHLSSVIRKKPIPGEPDRQRRFYGCRTDTGGCGKVSVTAELAEQVVYDTVLGLVDNPKLRQAVRTGHQAEADEVRALVLDNARDEKRLADLEDAFAAGDISRAGLQRNAKKLRAQVDERNSRIATLQGGSAVDRYRGRLREQWSELSTEDQRAVMLSVVDAVDVLPASKTGFNRFDRSRLVFRWKYGVLAEMAADWERTASEFDRAMIDRDARRHVMEDEVGNLYDVKVR